MADPKIEQLIASYIHDSRCNPEILRPQFKHRIALVDAWEIPSGSKVVDVGCGQGDSTIAQCLEVHCLSLEAVVMFYLSMPSL